MLKSNRSIVKDFRISVIIPVYNAERYLRAAVESTVHLPEVGEVVLIEDKSPDNALEVCKTLVVQHPKVKLFRHPNGENRGAGASRNLGIEHAQYDFVAFLDADDYYLPNRFEMASKILSENPSADGVYDAVGTVYYDNSKLVVETNKEGLTTVSTRPQGKMLFETLINPRGRGHFHTDAIVVRKSLLKAVGLFNTTLRLHQDTELWYRVAYAGNIYPGNTTTAVAMRGVHSQNRIAGKNTASIAKLHEATFNYFRDKSLSRNAAYTIFRNYTLYNKKIFASSAMNAISNLTFGAYTALRYPAYTLKILFGNG